MFIAKPNANAEGRTPLLLTKPRSRPLSRTEPNARSRIAAVVPPTCSAGMAFDEVVRLHWPRILRFVLRSVRDLAVAEDLTQDCFWKAYKGWKWFRGDSSVNTWLTHIAMNVIKSFARNKSIQFWRVPTIDPTSIGERFPDPYPSPEANV